MKLNRIIGICIILLLSILSINAINITDSEARTIITEDSFTNEDQGNTNYGTNVLVQIGSQTTADKHGYFEIDLTQQNISTSLITDAIFNYYKSTEANPSASYTYSWYYCNDSFDETTITWNNEATEVVNCDGSPFYTHLHNIGTGWKSVNLTSLIQTKQDDLFTIKIVVTPDSSATARTSNLYSKEQVTASNRPRLNVIYKSLDFVNISYDNKNITSYPYINSINPEITVQIYNDSTNSNINMSYSIDSSPYILFSQNNLIDSFNLSSLSETSHNLSIFIINNQTNNIENLTFIIDITDPIINNNILPEYNSYSINLNSSCSDINLLSCNISIDGQNIALNSSIINLNHNGNLNYNITAIDQAGNIVIDSGIILVNPIQYFYFQTSLSVPVTSFTLDGISYNNYANISTYNDIINLGSNSLLFESPGYDPLYINFTLTDTSQINLTTNVTTVTIFMRVFDINTLLPLVFDVQIENTTLIKTFTNLTNLTQDYQDVPTGVINIKVSSTGYSNGYYINNLQPDTSLSFDVYLTPENESDIITFTVQDFTTKNVLSGVVIEAQSVINDTRVTIQQVATGSSGVATLLLSNLDDYIFIFSKDGYTQALVQSIPGVNDYSVRLRSEAETFTYIDGVNVRFFPEQQTINTNVTYNFSSIISGVSITQATFTVYDQNNNILNTQVSTNPSGTTFIYEKLITALDNITFVYINLTYIKNGNIITQSTQYQVIGDLTNELLIAKEFGEAKDEETKLWRFFIILITFLTTIILGNRFASESRDKVVALLLLPTIIFTYIGWIPFLYGTVISIVIIVLYMGANKR